MSTDLHDAEEQRNGEAENCPEVNSDGEAKCRVVTEQRRRGRHSSEWQRKGMELLERKGNATVRNSEEGT